MTKVEEIYYTLDAIQKKVKSLDDSDSIKALRFFQRAVAELMDNLEFVKESHDLFDDNWLDKDEENDNHYEKMIPASTLPKPMFDLDDLV